jgi:HSP20 family molecular chaperone IbpA
MKLNLQTLAHMLDTTEDELAKEIQQLQKGVSSLFDGVETAMQDIVKQFDLYSEIGEVDNSENAYSDTNEVEDEYMPYPNKASFTSKENLIPDENWFPRYLVKTSGGDVYIDIETPGFGKTELDMSLEGEILIVSGSTTYDKNFSLKFRVGPQHKIDDIRTEYKDGLLEIIVLKAVQLDNDSLKIKIN